MFHRLIVTAAVLLLFHCLPVHAQIPRIDKVDPPNWWIDMPAPMLLVKGNHLNGAHFTLGKQSIERTVISENGHWAELWLGKNAITAGEILLKTETPQGAAQIPFTFEARHTATKGFAGFSSRDVMYLIMTDRFADGDRNNDGSETKDSADSTAAKAERANPRGWHGGDLRGIIEHLDYLQALGITTIWITPVYQNHSPEAYHGYHATDMYSVDEHFGSLGDLKALSNALHARGMKLLLDTVPNHVGPQHPWVDDSPEPTWFHGTKANHVAAVMDFQPLTNPYAPWRDKRDITEGWLLSTLCPTTTRRTLQLRSTSSRMPSGGPRRPVSMACASTHFPTSAESFGSHSTHSLNALYPHLTTVGEVSNPDPQIVSSFASGVTRNGVDTGLWSPLDFPLYFAMRDAFTGNTSMQKLATVLEQDALYPHPERLTPFIDNHDQIRFASEAGGTLQANKLAMAFLLTVRGMPHLYSGDEIYMQGYQDPDNRRDFPGGFSDSKSNNAFQASTRNSMQTEMFEWTSKLLCLRRETPALLTGSMQIIYTAYDSIVYTREEGMQRILIAIHRGSKDATVHISTHRTNLDGLTAASHLFGNGSIESDRSGIVIQFPANGVIIASIQ